MSKPHGHSIDDYLEAIHILVSPIGVVRAGQGSGGDRGARRRGARRLAYRGRRDAQAAHRRGPARARRRPRARPHPRGHGARGAGRPAQPDRRALPDRLPRLRHGRGARARRPRRRRHSRTTWSSACTRSSAIRSAARTAGRSPRSRTARRAASSSRWPTCATGDTGEIVRLTEQDGGLLTLVRGRGPDAGREGRDPRHPARGRPPQDPDRRRRAVHRRSRRARAVRAPRRATSCSVKAPLLGLGGLLARLAWTPPPMRPLPRRC